MFGEKGRGAASGQPEWRSSSEHSKKIAANWLRGDQTISGQGGNRTHDTRIFSPVLYQLSYLSGQFQIVVQSFSAGEWPERS